MNENVRNWTCCQCKRPIDPTRDFEGVDYLIAGVFPLGADLDEDDATEMVVFCMDCFATMMETVRE